MAKLDLQPVLDLQPAQPVKLDLQPAEPRGPTKSGMANQFFIGAANSTLYSLPELTHKQQFDKLESPYPEERIARGVGTAVGSMVGLPGLAFKMGSKLALKGMSKLAPKLATAAIKGSPMAKAIVEGAGGNAAYNLLDPATPLEDKPLNVLGGTIAGGALGAAGHVALEGSSKLPQLMRKPVKVPENFANTNEALAFGWQHKNNPNVLKELDTKRQEMLRAGDTLRSLADPTDAQMQEGMDIAVKGQFYREALEAAQGKITQKQFEQIQTKMGQKKPTLGISVEKPMGEFHGTGQPIEKLSDSSYTSLNYYGQGFYTTDDFNIAQGYMKKGGKTPTMYDVKPVKDVLLYDMEKEIPDALKMQLKKALGQYDEIVDDAKNLREVFDEVRDTMTGDGHSADTIQEVYDGLRYHLEQAGYRGLKHIGGLKTGKSAHNVKIYWNPASDIKLAQRQPSTPTPNDALNSAVEPPTTFLATGQSATPNPRADLVPSFKRLVPQDAKNLIADLDKRQTEILAADRGIIPAKTQNELSKGIDAKKMLTDWQPGQTVNAESMFAMRNHLVEEVLKLGEHASAEELESLSHKFIKADAMASETARTLGSLNRIQSMASDQIKFLTEHFKVLSPDAQKAASKVFKQFQSPTFWDKFMEFRTAALLTSPYTHARNAIGNSVVRLYNPLHKATAGAFDSMRSAITRTPRSIYASEGVADLIGAVHGIKPALRNAIAKLQNEDFISESRMMEALKHNQAIGGLKGKIIRSPFRALDAMDEFFSTLAHTSSLYSQATRQALKEGGKDWVSRAAYLVKNYTPEMVAKAEEAAKYDTYRQPLGGSMAALQAFFNGRGVVSKTAKFIVPFFKTPVNLFKWSYQRGPVTSMMPGAGNWKAIMKGTPEQKAEAWAKIALGQLVGAGIGLQVLDGNITGRLSGSKEKREAMMRQGVQPYSVKIGDKWVSYRSYEPITSWLALTANAIETSKEEGKMDATTTIKVTAETVKMMKDQSFLQGISDLTNALDDPERFGQKFIQNSATSLIPSGVGYLARLFDPVVREPDSIPDAIRAKLPGFSKGLPPKLDVWGRPITREGTLSERAILPSGVMTSKPDLAENELLSLEIFPKKVNRQYKGLNLSVGERNLVTQVEGGLEKTYLDQMVKMPYYQTLSPEEQAQAIEKMFTQVRKSVRTPFFRQKFVTEYRKLKTTQERAELLEKYTNKKLIKK